MPLTPEEIEERLIELEEGQKRRSRTDPRIPLLATNFDIEDMLFPPMARVYNSANILISNDTSTNLTFNSELFDTDGMHSATVNTGRLTCKTAGKYLLIAQVRWQEWSTGKRWTGFQLNGSTDICVHASTGDSGNTESRWQNPTTVYDLVVGDYVEVRVYQNRGGNLNVEAQSRHSPDFMAVRLGP